MSDVFHTRPEDARNLAGWYALPSGIEVMREPMTDEPSGLYARLDYDESEALAKSMGARLISMATLAEVWRVGCRIPPVTLVSNAEDTKRMRGRAFCEHHDSLARTHLAAGGWRRDGLPISGIGKHWIRGASPGKARNGGWPKPSGQFIQPGGSGSEHHDRHYTDYSQLAQFEREVGISMPPPIHTTPDGSTPAGSTPPPLRLRALAAARDQLARRIREAPGKAVDPQVSAYLGSCRRGGTSAAGILDLSGSPLGLRDDATAWCAAFASWCLAVSGPTLGEVVPHGYRISVAELVADAKARSCWRGPTERPELGWLAIWSRAGGDPVRGGTGHVGRVSQIGASIYSTIEGNHGDAVAEVEHRYDEPSLLGWVAYP